MLKNRLAIRDAAILAAFEAQVTLVRFEEGLPDGRLSYRHYRAVHRHLFQDVYGWAGRIRTVRLSKGGNMFCYPEQIDRSMRSAFGELKKNNFLRRRSQDAFAAGAATFLAEINAIHPFREGNGRTQLAFLTLLIERASWSLDLRSFDPSAMLAAMIDSFHGNEVPLAARIRAMLG